jgi:hypothetical protein
MPTDEESMESASILEKDLSKITVVERFHEKKFGQRNPLSDDKRAMLKVQRGSGSKKQKALEDKHEGRYQDPDVG